MIKTLLPIVSAALLPVSSLCAAVVGVQWGGTDIVTAERALNLPAGTDYSSTRVWLRTGDEPLTPTANYNAQAFHGIVQYNTGGTPSNLANAAILNRTDRNGDRFYLLGHSNSTSVQSIAGLVYVKKDEFMNGLNAAAPVRFDETSSMSIAIANIAAGGTGSTRVVRMAVQNDGQWYVSQRYASSVSTFTINDLLEQSWAAYSAEDSLPLGDTFGLTYDVLGSEFENIQAVGVYFLNSHTNPTARDFAFDQFGVSFAPIPEPSSVALLGLAAVGIGWGIRKRW